MKHFFVFYWRATAGTQAGTMLVQIWMVEGGKWTTKTTGFFKQAP